MSRKRPASYEQVGRQASVGDYNNDGFDDLFVTYWGQNVLYRNNGDGTFTDVTKAAGLLFGRGGAQAVRGWITIGTAARSVRLQLHRFRPQHGAARGRVPAASGKVFR